MLLRSFFSYYRMCCLSGGVLPVAEYTIDKWDCAHCPHSSGARKISPLFPSSDTLAQGLAGPLRPRPEGYRTYCIPPHLPLHLTRTSTVRPSGRYFRPRTVAPPPRSPGWHWTTHTSRSCRRRTTSSSGCRCTTSTSPSGSRRGSTRRSHVQVRPQGSRGTPDVEESVLRARARRRLP